jgi:hypothetical protein
MFLLVYDVLSTLCFHVMTCSVLVIDQQPYLFLFFQASGMWSSEEEIRVSKTHGTLEEAQAEYQIDLLGC